MFCEETSNYAANKAIRKLEESGQIGYYDTRTQTEVLLPEETYLTQRESYGSYQFTKPLNLEVGKIYTATYNGKKYDVECRTVGPEFLLTVAVGNYSMPGLGDENNGLPFCLQYSTHGGKISCEYFWNLEDGATSTFSLEQEVEVEGIIPSDPKYLPNTVPNIQTAEVGQAVVVKAVDENGKPTEWEAASVGGGSGGGLPVVELTTVVTETEQKLSTEEAAAMDAVLQSGLPCVVRAKFTRYNEDGTQQTLSHQFSLTLSRVEDNVEKMFYFAGNPVPSLRVSIWIYCDIFGAWKMLGGAYKEA